MRKLGRLWLGLVLVLCVNAPAGAALPPAAAPPEAPTGTEKLLGALGPPDCACEIDVAEFQRYRDLVAAAASAEEARRLAPWSGNLREAHGKLLGYEERVAQARTPEEAAQEFGKLVQLAGNGVSVGGNSGRCHYDTTEIIAIILGFIFFIIPGIILLIVFC